MPLWIKLCSPLVLMCLSGCATYIADKITDYKPAPISGDLATLTQPKTICADSGHCIEALALAHSPSDVTSSLKYDIKVNDNHKIWRYVHTGKESVKPTSLAKPMAIIFPGYGQPNLILTIMATWLHLESGADVFIIESADNSEHFQFGLDTVAPIISVINREKPSKVQLIGFSMGAVAAHAVAQQVDNAELHLVAPMTNFEQSALGLWNILKHDSIFSALISEETMKEAVGLVHERAKLSAQDIDIKLTAHDSATPAYIYVSHDDTVTPAKNWQGMQSNTWQLNKYQGLNHMEMVTLLRNDLFLSFAANLLGKEPDSHDISTFGLMCDADNAECLNQKL